MGGDINSVGGKPAEPDAPGTAVQTRATTTGSLVSLADRASRVWYLVRKEFMHITRNPQNFRLLMIAPILQLLVFGYACRLDVENVATVVADLDRSILSRQIIDAFSRSGTSGLSTR